MVADFPALERMTRRAPGRAAKIAGWAVLLFVVLFWRLGEPTFWDPDEAHYAETTRELLATGDWSAPYYNDEPFFDKPILFHLAQAVPMKLFGATETAARLVPALAALAVVGITAWLGRALIADDVAAIAALIVATSPGVFALARYAILDTLFTAFTFGGAALVSVAAFRDRSRLQYGGYVALALGFLTKGPLAIVLCGLAMLVAVALSRDARRRLMALHWVVGLAIVVAIAAPWFVYMWWRFRDGFVQGYILNENLRLFGRQMYGHQPGPWFYFQVLAAGLLPWTGLVIGRFVDWVRALVRRDDTVDTIDTLLWAWTIAIVAFFSLSKFKLDHYVFPATPALALLCGRAWSDLRTRPDDPSLRFARLGLLTVGPVFIAAGVGAGVFMIARLDLPRLAAIAPISIAVAGALVTARGTLLHWVPGRRVPVFVPAAMAITYACIIVFVLPALEQRKVVPGLARQVAAAASTARIASYRLNRWNTAFRFYVDRHVEILDSPEEARRFFAQPQPFYCVMLRPAYEEFVAGGVPLRVVAERAGMWATSGRVLWRRRLRPTRFVIVTRATAPQVLPPSF